MKHNLPWTTTITNQASWIAVFLVLSLTGCDVPGSKKHLATTSFNLRSILANDDTRGFRRAYDVRSFHFPSDHGSHPGYRNEWWYFTGNLATSDNRHFGYQVTFFRTALAPESSAQDSTLKSKWTGQNIWMAHAAVTDITAGQHHAEQRFSRTGPGLAGVLADPFEVWLDDWQIKGIQRAGGKTDSFPWQVTINADQFSLKLNLTATKKFVLQGDHGLSRKSATNGNASYYYSYSRLATIGQLTIKHDGQDNLATTHHDVTGNSWFDREWSTSSLDPTQSGWDWFSLQFDNGEELMYYQLLDLNGKADVNSQGSRIKTNGEKIIITRQEMQLTVLKTWQAPDGQTYPIKWRMEYADQNWIIQAAVSDQFMDLVVQYWEGAVEIFDTNTTKRLGRGYLEMTRINPVK